MSNRVVVPARQAGNRFLGSLKGLQRCGLVDNWVYLAISWQGRPIAERLLVVVWCPFIPIRCHSIKLWQVSSYRYWYRGTLIFINYGLPVLTSESVYTAHHWFSRIFLNFFVDLAAVQCTAVQNCYRVGNGFFWFCFSWQLLMLIFVSVYLCYPQLW